MTRLLFPVLVLLAALAGPGRAAETCSLPESLALRDLSLPAVKQAVAAGRLTVLMLGGAATAGKAAGDESMTLPARLQAALDAALPGVAVRVVNGGVPRSTAESGVRNMTRMLGEIRPNLVIWAAGAREAVLGLDVEPYESALQLGIQTVQKAGADLILMDMQYAPSITRIANLAPFRAALAGTASAHNVPLLERYELMMRWNDDGLLNLDARDAEERRLVARKLFGCLADALAGPIAAAAR